MGDENTNQKKRKVKWATSYSSMTMAEAEKRLGLRVKNFKAVPAAIMLANAQNSMEADAVKETTERVHRRIVEYLKIEGYPTEANTNFKETNISDLVLYIIGPVLFDFICATGRDSIQLSRERERDCLRGCPDRRQ